MINRASKASILISLFIANLFVLQSNASDVGKSAGADHQAEPPPQIKYRMYIATGKPREFINEEDYLEANRILDEMILRSRVAVTGSFDESSKSDFIEDKGYPGGGYYNFDFHIADNLKNSKDPVANIRVRVPFDFTKLSDQKYLSEFKSSWSELFKEHKAFKKKHERGEVTADEFSAYKDEWDLKIVPMQYMQSYILRIQRGEDFSMIGNEYAIFLGAEADGTFAFNHNRIYPIGRGTFIDILRHEKRVVIPDDDSQISLIKFTGIRPVLKDPPVLLETPPVPGTNLVQNGGFENNLNMWQVSGLWDTHRVSEPGVEGQGVLRISASPSDHIGGAAVIWQCIRTEKQQRYDFGARYKVGAESGKAGGSSMRLVWYEKNNCSGKVAFGDRAKPRKLSGWQGLSVSDSRPVGQATSVMIELIQAVSGEDEFVTYWDDIYFRPKYITKKAPENSM